MSEHAVCSPEARLFAQVDEYFSRLKLRSPQGRAWLESFPVSADPSWIEARLDETQMMLDWLRGIGGGSRSAVASDRVSWHLGRIPRLPDLSGRQAADEALGLADLFAVKKFLANTGAIIALLEPAQIEAFGLDQGLGVLAQALGEGGTDPETFYLADTMDADLATARRRIRELDAHIEAARDYRIREVEQVTGLDFAGADFLIIRHETVAQIAALRSLCAITPYDDARWRVSLQPSDEELGLEAERQELSRIEGEAEDRVLARLSAAVHGEAGRLRAAESAILRLDRALAGAALARDLGMVRPQVVGGTGGGYGVSCSEPDAGDSGQCRDSVNDYGVINYITTVSDSDSSGETFLALQEGRFLPCEAACARIGSAYTPLSVRFGQPVAMIFGSNMGGKTVALKTILFFQILAQAGFFVPARLFRAPVYRCIHYVGDLSASRGHGARAQKPAEGLSGFGFEIRAFVDAWRMAQAGGLLAFDEFARTTSAREAEALISAITRALARKRATLSLFATHHQGLPCAQGIASYRVPGLDRARAGQLLASGQPLAERIKMINGLMRFGLEPDSGIPQGSEAIAVAALLGLEPAIANEAAELYHALWQAGIRSGSAEKEIM